MKEFTCGACQKALSWQEELVGLEAECPFCGADITVPPAPGQTGGTIGIIEIGDSGVQPVAQTISSFLAERNLPGGVQLGDEGDSDSGLIDSLEAGGEQKYHVGERIAAGGMGAILNARDLNLKRRIAMKVMHHPDRVSDAQLARFIEEAQVTGQLEHPSIVPVHELGIDAQGRPFYTMKLLKGRTLQAILEDLKEGGAGEAAEKTFEDWPLGKLLNAFARICEAMRYAHSKGVIHRDLKPENIMVGEFGEVQVLDWGLAKILEREETAVEDADNDKVESVRSGGDSGRFLSMDGSIAGTPQYMAPEQASGKIKELDERTDVYALGAILYQILTLRAPVDGPNLQAILIAAAKGKVIPPEELVTEPLPHCPNEKIPSALSAMAMKALAHDPAKRYQKVEDLTRDLEQYQAGFATEAEEAGFLRQLHLLFRRHKTIAIASTLLLAAILAGSAVSLVQRNRAVAAHQTALEEIGKRRQLERDSVPSLIAHAKSYMEKMEWQAARKALRTAELFAPEDPEVHLLRSITAIESNLIEEAQIILTSTSVESNSLSQELLSILNPLDKTKPIPDNSLIQLARFANRLDLTAVGGTWASRAKVALEEKLPLYRAQIEKEWPGYGSNLKINKDWGLELDMRSFPKVDDLSPLRGIPLAYFWAGKNLEGVDLSPLADMPLSKVFIGGRMDVSPLADLPLEEIDMNPGHQARLLLNPQVRKIGMANAENRPLDSHELKKCRHLHKIDLQYGGFDSLDFLFSCTNMTFLRASSPPLDGKYDALFSHRKLSYVHPGMLRSACSKIITLLEGGEHEAALSEASRMTPSIQCPALAGFREKMAALEIVLGGNRPTSWYEQEKPAIFKGSDRALAIVPLAYESKHLYNHSTARMINDFLSNSGWELAVIETMDELSWARKMIGHGEISAFMGYHWPLHETWFCNGKARQFAEIMDWYPSSLVDSPFLKNDGSLVYPNSTGNLCAYLLVRKKGKTEKADASLEQWGQRLYGRFTGVKIASDFKGTTAFRSVVRIQTTGLGILMGFGDAENGYAVYTIPDEPLLNLAVSKGGKVETWIAEGPTDLNLCAITLDVHTNGNVELLLDNAAGQNRLLSVQLGTGLPEMNNPIFSSGVPLEKGLVSGVCNSKFSGRIPRWTLVQRKQRHSE